MTEVGFVVNERKTCCGLRTGRKKKEKELWTGPLLTHYYWEKVGSWQKWETTLWECY